MQLLRVRVAGWCACGCCLDPSSPQQQSFEITECSSRLFQIASEYLQHQRAPPPPVAPGPIRNVQPELVDSPPPTRAQSMVSRPAQLALAATAADGSRLGRAATASIPRPVEGLPVKRSVSAAAEIRHSPRGSDGVEQDAKWHDEHFGQRAPSSSAASQSSERKGSPLQLQQNDDVASVKSLHCNVCSTEVVDSAMFCSECGAKVAQGMAAELTPRSTTASSVPSTHNTPPGSRGALTRRSASQEGGNPFRSREGSSSSSTFHSPLGAGVGQSPALVEAPAAALNPFLDEQQDEHEVAENDDGPGFYSAPTSPAPGALNAALYELAEQGNGDDSDAEEAEGVRL